MPIRTVACGNAMLKLPIEKSKKSIPFHGYGQVF